MTSPLHVHVDRGETARCELVHPALGLLSSAWTTHGKTKTAHPRGLERRQPNGFELLQTAFHEEQRLITPIFNRELGREDRS